MKSKPTNGPQTFSDDCRLGLWPYIESRPLHDDIETILSHRHAFSRIKELTLLRSKYGSSLSHGHINYYIRQQKQALRDRLFGVICLLLVAAYFAFILCKIRDSYQAYHNLDMSESAFQKAVEYYEKGEYAAALLRFQTLYDGEWDSASSARYLSSIYQMREDYDAAAEILLDYLIYRCGLANISTDNSIYAELRDIYVNKPLSEETAAKVSTAMSRANAYAAVYIQLFSAIREQDYDTAGYLCQNLESSYANGYYFVSCYANALVNTGRATDAYNLIMETVRDDRSPEMRMISVRQRVSLVNYIYPYLSEEQQSECGQFLSDELPALKTVSDSDSAEPFLPYDDVEYLFRTNASIASLKYLNPLDSITAYEETALVCAKEMYRIELIHHDGSRISKEYFFMDMKKNIYLRMNGKYVLLPTDEASNAPAEQTGAVSERYALYGNPHIELLSQYKGAERRYAITNTATGETIFCGPPTSLSMYGAFSYIQIEDACLTVFFSAYDAVILVTRDPGQTYTELQGLYQKEDTPVSSYFSILH